jgi:hypothetical protein
MSNPDYIPCPNPLLAACADESVTGNTCSAQDIQEKLLTAHHEWVQGDNAARHIIRSTIAQHIKTSLPPVITSEGITHARDYWKLLESDYDAVSFNDTADLEVQLSLLRMTDSPLKYISEIRRIQSTLLKRGCGCSNVSLINHLLHGLPDEKHWREWRHTEMASWKLQHVITFNDIAHSIITQATNFDIRGAIDDGIVILCNKTGFQYSKLSTNTSNIFTSSSTSETPHDLAEDDYHKVGWDYDDEEEEGEGEIDEEEGEMDERGDEEETDIASFNLELSSATPSQNEFNSDSEFTSVALNPSLTSSFYSELSTPMDFNSNGDFMSVTPNHPLDLELSAAMPSQNNFNPNDNFASITLNANATISNPTHPLHIPRD